MKVRVELDTKEIRQAIAEYVQRSRKEECTANQVVLQMEGDDDGDWIDAEPRAIVNVGDSL